MKKPTDEEFLYHLCEKFTDPWASEIIKMTGDKSYVNFWINSGAFTEDDRGFLNNLHAEWRNPKRAVTGSFISVLKEATLQILGSDREKVSKIPVGLLPTRLINASTIRTPRNGSVILLDSAVLYSLPFLLRSYFALDSWRTSDPFCRDHSEEEFAQTIILLAYFCASGNVNYLKQAPALKCPSIPDYDETTTYFAFQTEIFILLHEYAHVISGHLNSGINSIHIGKSIPVEIYTKAQFQEFEADRFAISKIVEYSKGESKATDNIVGPSLLFCLFGLVEAIFKKKGRFLPYTHPPAVERWKRIREYVNLSSYPKAYAVRIEPCFRKLMEYAYLT